MERKKTYKTNFAVAKNWLNNKYILCNEIAELDESVWMNIMPDYNVGFDENDPSTFVCPECGEEIRLSKVVDEDGEETGEYACGACDTVFEPDAEYRSQNDEIFQWLLSDCDRGDVEFLRKHFGLKFSYSDMLDLYVLCVTHYGTAWDYVSWKTDLEQAAREEGQPK